MAKSRAIWGIDIGQCALKALRCRPSDGDSNRIVADSFDYIEYPKILSQPEADPEALVRDALAQFLSRNDLTGDRVAISVSGQSGLARFIKLPPVESKKIPDIVKYEARQQIPFALEDVVWDYQQMAGGGEDDGFALETEVGLFAMKRDQVMRALRPFDEAAIAVDWIQLAPLAIFNYTVFDHFADLPPVDQFDPDNPPPSTVVLSLGTDTTDLVVTNGYRVWQRSIPIGGSHFTKALTKELRLTFSKAEHLKRHARKAENAKAVFQAMRPVFSDLLSEIQRSLGFFASLDRNARVGRILGLGNAMKLPGLIRYLSQNLEQEVKPVTSFASLEGDSVVGSPQFKENLLGFAAAYGLCLQGLNRGTILTNLLPKEIVTERLIRAKKPWVVAAIAATLLGCTVNFFGTFSAYTRADVKSEEFARAISAVKNTETQSQGFKTDYETAIGEREKIIQRGKSLVSNVEGRLNWLQVLKAIDVSLPQNEKANAAAPAAQPAAATEPPPAETPVESPTEPAQPAAEPPAGGAAQPGAGAGATPAVERSKDPTAVENALRKAREIMARRELHIMSIDCERFDDLSVWHQSIAAIYRRDHGIKDEPLDAGGGFPDASQPDPYPDPAMNGGYGGATDSLGGGADMTGAVTPGGPGTPGGPPGDGKSGPGWVIQIRGFHYHNEERQNSAGSFVRNTLLHNLKDGSVSVATAHDDKPQEVLISDLGVHFPVLVQDPSVAWEPIEDREAQLEYQKKMREANEKGLGNNSATREQELLLPPEIKLRRYEFVVQFSWQPTTEEQRAKLAGERKKAEEAKKEAERLKAEQEAQAKESTGEEG